MKRMKYLTSEIHKINPDSAISNSAFVADEYIVKAPKEFITELQEEVMKQVAESGLVIVGVGEGLKNDTFTMYNIPFTGKVLLEEASEFSITKVK